MGIVNLTEDSFYAASRTALRDVCTRVASLLEQGADVIDLGACSTRPGAWQPGPEEEWARPEGPKTRFPVAPDLGRYLPGQRGRALLRRSGTLPGKRYQRRHPGPGHAPAGGPAGTPLRGHAHAGYAPDHGRPHGLPHGYHLRRPVLFRGVRPPGCAIWHPGLDPGPRLRLCQNPGPEL